MADGPKVKRYAQPLGKAGIAHSLDMVSMKAIEGGKDEVVRAWDTHVLKGCGFPKGARARAACFLADTRLYPWIPDPTDVEFIPAPRLMMPNVLTGEGPVYLAEDCDGLTARWIAMCLAAGIRCQIVGYSFDADQVITHVLGSIWDDVAEEWVDGEPSFQDMPLGTTQAHTWEQRRDLPTMEITCDDVSCDMRRKPDEEGGVVDFVGVGKPGPRGASMTLGTPVLEASGTGEVREGLPSLDEVGKQFRDAANDIDAHWDELKALYDMMREQFAAEGISTVEQLAPFGWSAENQQMAIDLGVMAKTASRYLNEAADGVRGIWLATSDEPAMKGITAEMEKKCLSTGGKFTLADSGSGGPSCECPANTSFSFYDGCVNEHGVATQLTWAVATKPEDLFGVELDNNGNPILVNAQGNPSHAPPGNSIGAPVPPIPPIPIVPILVVGAVIYLAVAYAIPRAIQGLSEILKTIMEDRSESRILECYKPGSGVSKEECDKRVREARENARKREEIEAARHKNEGDNDPMAGVVRAINSLVYVGGAVLTVYGVVKLVEAVTANKRTARA